MADGALLAQLHFGREDAERDVQDGLLLRGGFLPNAAYRGALSGRKMLIIGRKGSGKSAICMRLKAAGAGHYAGTELIPPDETAGEEIRRFELQGLPGDSAKALIWRYLFAVYAARHLVAHAKDAHGRSPDSVKALARFLKQNGEAADGRFGDRLAQAVRGCRPRCPWRRSDSRRDWTSRRHRCPKGRRPHGSWMSWSRVWHRRSPTSAAALPMALPLATASDRTGRCCSWSTS